MKRVFERLIDARNNSLKLKTTQIVSINQSINQTGCVRLNDSTKWSKTKEVGQTDTIERISFMNNLTIAKTHSTNRKLVAYCVAKASLLALIVNTLVVPA